jgi:hypothetical protein
VFGSVYSRREASIAMHGDMYNRPIEEIIHYEFRIGHTVSCHIAKNLPGGRLEIILPVSSI